MLTHLFIKNFALIQEVSIEFKKGYTVFTGETGSGKSIFLNALNLILGERADYKVIGPDADKAVVEATFDLSSVNIQSFFEQFDIDYEVETIIRREVTKQGKSRTFVNDIPVPLSTLKELTGKLISIHSQYNTLDLKRKEYQLFVLDILANTWQDRKSFEEAFVSVQKIKKTLAEKEEQLLETSKNQDYILFQLNELNELELTSTNFEDLERQLKSIENAGEIKHLNELVTNLFEDEKGIISLLATAKNSLQRLVNLDPSNDDKLQRLIALEIESKDLVNEFETSREIEISDFEIQTLLTKVDKFNSALRKHRLSSQEELLEVYTKLAATIEGSEDLQDEIESLKEKIHILDADILVKASKLHEKRLKPIESLEKKFSEELSALKLPNTRIKFELKPLQIPNKTGISDLDLLFSANIGMDPVAIENAASGGELSRVMLIIQKLISEKIALPTLFFDEIDTGVSGDVAQRIGFLLQQMGENIQLFAISHLPQVAAKAQWHYKVEKKIAGERTLTEINPVNGEDRVVEIAKLMSGDVVNAAAIENARLLM